MTINRISILRSSALVALIIAACAHPAPSQQVGSPFPERPPGAECEQRLQRLRAVATPSVTTSSQCGRVGDPVSDADQPVSA